FDVVVWTTPDLFTHDLAEGAQLISEEVDIVTQQRGISRLSIVAECDAGVAARYSAQVLGNDAKIDQLVTFVSAHHGTQSAAIGAWVTGWGAVPDITPNSGFMEVLNSAPMPASLHLTSIYTCNDEYLYPYDTSVVNGATNVEFCNHYIGHFDGFWDSIVYD